MGGETQEEPENKRIKQDARSYNITRRFERQRSRKVRLSTRELSKNSDVNIEAIICDGGGYTLKVGSSVEQGPRIIPNCIMKAKSERKRLFIGDQINECRDCSGLFYLLPCEKGYITKWDVQKPIWDYVFNKNACPLNELPLVMTQPLMNFKLVQECMDEIFFEEFEAQSMVRVNPSDLAMWNYMERYDKRIPCLVVDSGFSFTHVVPYIDGKKYFKGTKRLNVGGKLLTNHLKDIISYRQYHVMEETFVINQVKEDTCFVSEDFKADLKIAGSSNPQKNHILRNYVLPDFNNIRRGYIQDPNKPDELAENCQILKLNNERFTVPEILFHPSDIGIKSMGIAECIVKSILDCPEKYRKKLSENIVVVGGNTKFTGFKNRLYNEVRSLICDSWDVNIHHPDDPITYSWMGGKAFLKQPEFRMNLVTKEQYEEMGSANIRKKFEDWYTEETDEESQQEIKPISLIEHIKKYNVFGKSESQENTDTEIKTEDNRLEKGEDKPTDVEETNKLTKKTVRTTPVLYSFKILQTDAKTLNG